MVERLIRIQEARCSIPRLSKFFSIKYLSSAKLILQKIYEEKILSEGN